MWECAILVCKELMRLYEEETFEYDQLSTLHRRMSQFYDCITKQLRPKPEYFRVACYGKGFPTFLSNKVPHHFVDSWAVLEFLLTSSNFYRFLFTEEKNTIGWAIFAVVWWISTWTPNWWIVSVPRRMKSKNRLDSVSTGKKFDRCTFLEQKISVNVLDLQINHVEPIMDERKRKLSNKTIHERILWYHR